MAGSGILNFSYQGGDASAQVTTTSGQALTVSANPLFGSGSTSGSGTSDPSQNVNPSTSQVSAQTPAGVGLIPAAIGGSVAAAAPLSSSTLLLIGLAALALVLSGGGGGRH